ncbi:MAG: prevent-host-death protein [Paenibacillus sp.]|nr:prevent-host-death protein [Paenibacillus sp.]
MEAGVGRMANQDTAYRRMLNQRIMWENPIEPGEVIQRLGAMQAQDYGQALWGIGLRTQNKDAADVERAIADKRIVLTWAMRGTLHLVPAADVKWMLALLAPRIVAKQQRRLEQLGIDDELVAFCEVLLYDALTGHWRLSRPNLMKLLEEAGVETRNQRGYTLLWILAQKGLICHGPLEDKQQTFVLLDEWVQDHNRLSVEQSLVTLALRYFTGHGPATLHDFVWWTGLTVAEAKRGLEAAAPSLVSEKIDGVPYWMGMEQVGRAEREPFVCLLPGYDEYLLGYKDRGAVLEAERAPLLVQGSNGVFAPMLVIDGQIEGIWKRTIKKKAIELSIQPFSELGERKEHVLEAAARYSRFLGLPISRIDFA